MIRDSLRSHYATRNVTQFPLALRKSSRTSRVMERYGGREEIGGGVNCGLHSDTQCDLSHFWSPLV